MSPGTGGGASAGAAPGYTLAPVPATPLIDRRLLAFLLYDWLEVEALCSRPRYAEHARAGFDAMLDAADRLARHEFAPHHRAADLVEPRFDGERVHLIPEIGAALDAFAQAGFLGAGFDAALGGLQLPHVVEQACFAHFNAANVATTGYALITIGNARLLAAHGTPAQIEAFARPQLEGRAFGTMCLSEPQAGSSLSDIRTRALPDGEDVLGPRYRLTGSKMWISGGEHELGENIVHLVLAKVPGADGQLPAGTQGISLFAVPRRVVDARGVPGERNDVTLAGLNHKMGYRGTVNTLLNFGEGRHRPQGRAGALGWRIGAEGAGLAAMFHMMNEARIGVGLGAAMIGYAAYRYSSRYARERSQGRPVDAGRGKDAASAPVPIVRHADIRRMLLAQKAYSEGAFALSLACARLVDEQHTAPEESARAEARLLLDLLTPVAKSWPSEWCLEGNHLAIQVLGGYGYTRDYPVEQHWRDNRLNMIHEGTHGIQALDLLGRKVLMRDGAALALFARRLGATLAAAQRSGEPALVDGAQRVQAAAQRVESATRTLWRDGDTPAALAHATPYLQAFGHVVLGWIWLDLAVRAHGHADAGLRVGVQAAARYFHVYELPRVAAWLAPAEARERLLLDLPEDVL